jgi:hypothetical protein
MHQMRRKVIIQKIVFDHFDHFPKYHMKSSLGDFNAKLEREDIFKTTIGNESLHQDSNDNGVSIVNLPPEKL